MGAIKKSYNDNIDIVFTSDGVPFIKAIKNSDNVGTSFSDDNDDPVTIDWTIEGKADGEITFNIDFDTAVYDDLQNIYFKVTGNA